MLGCYLKAIGEDFDVDAFGAGSSLNPDDVFHRGEKTEFGKRTHDASGLYITINEDFGKLRSQLRDAAIFLEANRKELLRLSEFPNVSDIRLVFTYCPGHIANVCEYFPSELLASAGSLRIGFELSVYPE